MSKRWLLTMSLALVLPASLAAQNAVTTSGTKGTASATDAHVRSTNATNSTDAKVAPPPSKGGPTAKGPYGTCNVHVDNSTAYYVQFYFNGDLAGVIGPWGDLYPNITPGQAELYARAVFDDGSVLTFGPRQFLCSGSDFHWTLTP
jgi:hypothetical protein